MLVSAVVVAAAAVGILVITRSDGDAADGGGTTVASAVTGSSAVSESSATSTARATATSSSAVPQTPPTPPPTTAPPFPGLSSGASADTVASMDIATQLARAYAAGDWATVRRLNPSRVSRSDSNLASAYGDLDASTPVWVSGGGSVPLRLGLVAHQTRGGSQLTTIYCVRWSVDLASSTVYEDGSRSETLRSTSGWVDPVLLVTEIQSQC